VPTACEVGPYYPVGTISTVPRAYDIFKAYEGMEVRKMQIKNLKKENIQNEIDDFKLFLKTKIPI
jgi:hypothetical protein